MTRSLRFPLLAKVLGWLILHLVLLGLAFFLFVRWQLGMGLDSLLSGSAGERLSAFGDTIASHIVEVPRHQWNDAIQTLANEKKFTAAVFDPAKPGGFPNPLPSNVLSRVRSAMPVQHRDAGPPGPPDRPLRPGGRPPPRGFEDDGAPPLPPDHEPETPPRGEFSRVLPKSRPAFLLRAENGDGYWAGVLLHLPPGRNLPRQPVMLLIRADRLDGSGMFFEFKPWLLGGIAVLLLSLACWTPFVWRITGYLHRLTTAADRIASGDFKLSLPPRGNDELGNLGRTIESMAARLEHLITGQKRFLGDAAHELCAPLARIRTGIGILEMKLAGVAPSVLSSIEADTAELAALVNEILAFSRAGNRTPSRHSIPLEPLVHEVLAREAADVAAQIDIPHGLTVFTDPILLGRSLGNLIRNAAVHAGPRANVIIHAGETVDAVSITVTDNGPGVPATELAQIFEPFYRLDRSRSRDTGGSGLGLAIVRTSIESCGGEAIASLPATGGFSVTLRLPKRLDAMGADPHAAAALRKSS